MSGWSRGWAKDEARRDKLRHRISFAQRRIAELQGKNLKADRPLTDADLATIDDEAYREHYPLAILEVAFESGLVPERFRAQVEEDLAEERRQRLLKHPGIVIATTNVPGLQEHLNAEAAEAREVQAEERERLASNGGVR